MKRVRMTNPFTAGMVTDIPAYELGPKSSAFAQDLIAPEGIARQRKGWVYDGTTADVADNLRGVYRNKFILADVTRTITGDDDGDLFVHNSSSSGTAIFAGSVEYLPRCVYGDEMIWCAQDGQTPLRRYSGAAFTTDSTVTNATYDVDLATIRATSGTFGTAVLPGSYAPIFGASTDVPPYAFSRVLERISSTVLTVEGIKTSLAYPPGRFPIFGTAPTYPCVNVYDAGTGSFDAVAGEFNGTGTKWLNGDWGSVADHDALLAIRPAGSSSVANIADAVSDSKLDLEFSSQSDTNLNYAILRSCPFKDAQAHKGSFWGTGVAQFPNNVYVGPPGWNLSFPPGFTLPYDPTVLPESTNVNDFLMDSIAVPSAYDGDVNVAILSSPNPLLVLKRGSVYGITGSFPNFSTDKIEDGAGCIDLRSAISTNNGQFWAGENGIYAYVGGQVIDLTNQKINREWRALTRVFDYGTSDYCAIGQSYDHLFVSIVTGGGATNRCYVYDLRAQVWTSRFTNHKARHFFSSSVDGEAEELYWVGDSDQGRVMKSSVTLNATGIAKDGDGDSPRMQAWTGEGIDGDNSLDTDTRMLDLAISANVYDAGTAGSTQLGVSVVSGGSLEAQASATKTLTAISSDTVDRVDRKRYREVNKKGRLQQVRVDVGTLGTNSAATSISIAEIAATFRSRRDRT